MISYLPTLKDKNGNHIMGLMGQYNDEQEARDKLYGDFIFWIPFGLSVAGITEYNDETGLPNVKVDITLPQFGSYEGAVIRGPTFDEANQCTD